MDVSVRISDHLKRWGFKQGLLTGGNQALLAVAVLSSFTSLWPCSD